jgi:hypothetical protein
MDAIQQLKSLAGVNEASVNISLNGTNSQEIKDLMGIFQADAAPKPSIPPMGPIGMDAPPPPGLDLPDIKPPIGPSLPPALPGLDGPMPPMPPPKPMGMALGDDPFGLGDGPMGADDGPIGLDDGSACCDSCGGIHGDEPCGESEDWENSPKEKYQDKDYMTKDLAGGLNRPKPKKALRVKDPAVESTIKQDLWKALTEKYEGKGSNDDDEYDHLTKSLSKKDKEDDDENIEETSSPGFDSYLQRQLPKYKVHIRKHGKEYVMNVLKKRYDKMLAKKSAAGNKPTAVSQLNQSEEFGEEQTFSGRDDRTYFVVPNEDNYTDIQNDNRFAGDIEIPDENADIMALPNSKARKLKMMYGNKIIDLGTDYDKAVEREEKKSRRRHLANISRTRAGGSAGSREAEGMGDLRRLAGLEEAPLKKKYDVATENSDPYAELDAEANKFSPEVEKMLDAKYLKFHNGDPNKRAAVGQKLQARFDKMAANKQGAMVKAAKPKPKPSSTNTFKGSGIKSKPLQYNPSNKNKQTATNTSGNFGDQVRAKANKLMGRS